MPEGTNCPACEEGGCLEHQSSGSSAGSAEGDGGRGSTPPGTPSDAVTRNELHQFRKKVARSVKRLNRAVKQARREQREEPTGVEPPPEPPTPQPGSERRMSDVAKLGLGVFRSCRRK